MASMLLHLPIGSQSRTLDERSGRLILTERAFILLHSLAFVSGRAPISRLLPTVSIPAWMDSGALFFSVLSFLFIIILSSVCHSARYAPRVGSGGRWAFGACFFHFYIAASYLWSPANHESPDNAFLLILTGINVAIAGFAFYGARGDSRLRYFMFTLYIIALAYAFDSMRYFVASGNWNVRIHAFGGGPNVFARIVGMGLLCSLYLWLRSECILWILPAPLFFLCILLSGSRGGLVATMAALAVVTMYFVRSRRIRWRLLITIILIVCILQIIGYHWPDFSSRVWGRYVEQTLIQRYSSGRGPVFHSAWEVFRDHPVLGVGLDGYTHITGYNYPHNLLLHLASEVGLVGLFMFAYLTFRLVRRWRLQKDHLVVFAASLGVLFAVASMFSGDIYDARMMWLFFSIYMMPSREFSHPYQDARQYSMSRPYSSKR